MLLIKDFLDRAGRDELDRLLKQVRFTPGQGSGGTAGRLIKTNEQSDPRDPNYPKAASLVLQAIHACAPLHEYAFASKVTPIIFSRYGAGMAYGAHVDAAIHSLTNMVIRTDISFTLFLSGPEEYEGGELVIDNAGAEKVVKGDAGDLFLYPTGVTHRVNAVRSGWRRVAVGWIQSLVANHEQRQVLQKLQAARDGLLKASGRTAEFELVNSAYENLLRMCSQP